MPLRRYFWSNNLCRFPTGFIYFCRSRRERWMVNHIISFIFSSSSIYFLVAVFRLSYLVFCILVMCLCVFLPIYLSAQTKHCRKITIHCENGWVSAFVTMCCVAAPMLASNGSVYHYTSGFRSMLLPKSNAVHWPLSFGSSHSHTQRSLFG